MIGMALMAVLMCVGFASCSEEEPDGGDSSNEKKLTKLASADSHYSFTFTYDDKGRLSKVTEISDYSDEESYLWGDNAIKCESFTITLENGLAQHENGGREEYVYTYNQSDRLLECNDMEFMWDGDKLVSVTEVEMPNSDYETTTEIRFTYEETCRKGYNPYITGMLSIGSSKYLYIGHPELLGLRTKQLPKSVTSTRTNRYNTSSETTNFSYEFDKEGYISKMKIEEIYEGESSTNTVTLTWE